MKIILERLWRLLPDRCQMPGCCRAGVRGNENLIDGKIMCDYCHAEIKETKEEWFKKAKLRRSKT